MSSKKSLQLIEECDRLVQLLREINPGLTVGNINVETLVTNANELRDSVNMIEDGSSKLISHRNVRDQRERTTKLALSALRDAVRVDYGANSPEYERSGRTPISKWARRNDAPKP